MPNNSKSVKLIIGIKKVYSIMDMKNIKEFIKIAKESQTSSEFKALIADFESLTDLYAGGKEGLESIGMAEKIGQAQAKFWAALEAVLPSFGLTPELLDAYLDNPDNFSAAHWQKVQELKQQVEGS